MSTTSGPPRESGRDDAEVADLFARLPEDLSARDELAARFASLAAYLARRFAGRGEPLEDLVQVANVGLLGAIDRFDPSREVQFATFATATIVGELKRHLRDKVWTVRIPRGLQELGLRVNRLIPELTQQLGRSPTVAELAEQADAPLDEVVEAMDAMQAYSADSLDAPAGEEGVPAIETIAVEDESLELFEGMASVAPSLAELSPRDRRVLYLRFFAERTQSEIAAEIGVSQMHVSRILSQTLERLRTAVAESSPSED